MMPTCEGITEEAKWETSINIPLTNCKQLGLYSRNMKRVVQITFLFMKHKQCFLQRWKDLPQGIYIDEAYPKIIQQRPAILRPVLKHAQ